MSTVKTSEDIVVLREGGKRLARILATLASEVGPGMTTKDLDRRAEELVRAGGDEPVLLGYKPSFAARPYPATICISVNDEIVHGIPSAKRVLKEGDLVGFDLAMKHNGLIVDAARTVAVGKTDAIGRKLIAVAEEALAAGIAAAHGGKRVGDIGSAIHKVFKRYKLETPLELGGHGVGYKVHEEPEVPNMGRAGTGEVLRPGMVIAIEPMVTEGTGETHLAADGYTVRTADGKRSAHVEHTIVITDGTPEILTEL